MKTGLESLDIGAPKITYSGNEGPQSPQQMAEIDPLLLEEYEKYVFEMEEQGLQPMSLEQFKQQAMSNLADGGRIGFFRGALADTQGPAGGQAMSPGTSTTGGTRHSGGGGENGGTTTPKPKPKVKKNISTGSLTPTTNFLKKFRAHDKFTDQLKAR